MVKYVKGTIEQEIFYGSTIKTTTTTTSALHCTALPTKTLIVITPRAITTAATTTLKEAVTNYLFNHKQ